MEKSRAYIYIAGDVQGVNFRYRTFKKAESLELLGWVRNSEDGGVETEIEGEKENIEKLIDWLRKGPMFAKVKNIKVSWKKYQNEFKTFEIKY